MPALFAPTTIDTPDRGDGSNITAKDTVAGVIAKDEGGHRGYPNP